MTNRYDTSVASIHKDAKKRSPYFYCAYTLPDGRRALKSTKLRNKAAAMTICLQWQAASKKAKTRNFGEAQARKVLNEILEVSGQPLMNLQTVQEFLRSWLAGKQHAKAPGTAQRYRDALEPFLKSLGVRSTVNLASLAMADVNKFVAESQDACLSNKTINFRLKTIRSVLESARRQGLVPVNVAAEVPILPDTSAEKGRFTTDEIKALLDVVDDEWLGIILVGLTAALRIGDAASLCWENVDLDRGVIDLFVQKRVRTAARRRHEVPILPDLEEHLRARQAKRVLSGPIFPSLAKKSVTGNAGLSNTFSRLIARAQIDNPAITNSTGGKSRSVYKLSFHSLRHTYVTVLANDLGVSREVRMKLTGHTSSAHDRYTHFDIKTLADQVKSFPRFREMPSTETP